mmetsp:Transcript_47228/g.156545  ORF Transcript_47228/g.156545 Transcript_47228/m.156545 type:complete len:214 (+) Transcript_47228:166-807(+)
MFRRRSSRRSPCSLNVAAPSPSDRGSLSCSTSTIVRLRLSAWTPWFGANGARTRVRLGVEPCEPDLATVAEAARWPAHLAAFEDDETALAAATSGWHAAEWEALDCCGNTIGHIAAMRGSLRCLSLTLREMAESSANLSAQNTAGWSMLEESIDRLEYKAARAIFDAVGAAEKASGDGQRRPRRDLKERALEALADMPDVSLKVRVPHRSLCL